MKTKRGRRAGQLAKAHYGVKDTNEHIRLAARGDYPLDVQKTAFWLSKLAKEMDEILTQPRAKLEQSKTARRILSLSLPAGESFSPDERRILRDTGFDVHWLLQKSEHLNNEPLLILSRLFEVAKNPKAAAQFFKKLAQRFEAESPTTGPVEPLYSRLAELKRLLETPALRRIALRHFPFLKGARERGLTAPEIRKFVGEDKCPYHSVMRVTSLRARKTYRRVAAELMSFTASRRAAMNPGFVKALFDFGRTAPNESKLIQSGI